MVLFILCIESQPHESDKRKLVTKRIGQGFISFIISVLKNILC